MARLTCISVALLALALVTGCSAGRRRADEEPRAAPSRHVLPNGVRVIIEPHRVSDVVALQLWVQAGGRDENAKEPTHALKLTGNHADATTSPVPPSTAGSVYLRTGRHV